MLNSNPSVSAGMPPWVSVSAHLADKVGFFPLPMNELFCFPSYLFMDSVDWMSHLQSRFKSS